MPVRAASDPWMLPFPWRTAFEALIDSTAREGLPWSCPGGLIALSVPRGDGAAVLTVTDAKGRTTTRPVARPADVGPTGKALLAAPRIAVLGPPETSAPPVVAPPLVAPPRVESPRAQPPPEPRLRLAVMTGPRVSGPDEAVWMSGSLRGTIPFGPWALGLWTRFDLPVALARPLSPYFSMSSVSVGLGGSRSFLAGPIALEAQLGPSVVVVSMEEAKDEAMKHPEGARVVLRIGAELGATARINDWLRGRIAFDGEVAPAEAKLIAEGFPRPPRYMLGLTLGLEAVIH